jgi:hypothetical protein
MEGDTGTARKGGQKPIFPGVLLVFFPIPHPTAKISNSKFTHQLTDCDYSDKLEIVEMMRV